MSKPITNEQKAILLAYRRAHGVTANPHSRQDYHRAYYGQEEVRGLFEHRPHIPGHLCDRSAPAALGLLAEMYMYPNLTLEELMDCTSDEAQVRKADIGEFLKSTILNPNSVGSRRLLNQVILTGGERIYNLLGKEVAAGRLDTRKNAAAFARDYGILIDGMFDWVNQGMMNSSWNKTEAEKKKLWKIGVGFGGMNYYCETRYEGEFQLVLEEEGQEGKMPSLLAFFAGDPPYRQDCTDLLHRCFGDGEQAGLVNVEESLRELEQRTKFQSSFYPKDKEQYGLLAKLEPVEQMLLMTDPELQAFVRMETGEDHLFRKATYNGKDLKFDAPLETISDQEAADIREHMYAHMSHELALALYPTLDAPAQQSIFRRYLRIQPEEYEALDDVTRQGIRELRAANGVIPEMTADGVAELADLLDAEAGRLAELREARRVPEAAEPEGMPAPGTVLLPDLTEVEPNPREKDERGEAYYQALEKAMKSLSRSARRMDLHRKGCEAQLAGKLAQAMQAAADYLTHEDALPEPRVGEDFRDDHRRNRVAQVRHTWKMLSRNLEEMKSRTFRERIPGLRTEQREYDELHRALSEKKGMFRGADSREYTEMMAALEKLQAEVKKLAPKGAGLSGEELLKLDKLRAEAMEKTGRYISEKKDLDQIRTTVGIHRAQAARKLLEALDRRQNYAYRRAAERLEPQLREQREAMKSAMKALRDNRKGIVEKEWLNRHGEEILKDPMGPYFLKNLATISGYISDDKLKQHFREAVEEARNQQLLGRPLYEKIENLQAKYQGAYMNTNLASSAMRTMVEAIPYCVQGAADPASRYREILGTAEEQRELEEKGPRQQAIAGKLKRNRLELLNARIGKAMEGNRALPDIDRLYETTAGDEGYFARREKPEQRLASYGAVLTQLYHRLPERKTDEISVGVGKLIYDMVREGPFTREELKRVMPQFREIYNFGVLAHARRDIWAVAGAFAVPQNYTASHVEKPEPKQVHMLAAGCAAMVLLEMGEKSYSRMPDLEAFLEGAGKLTVGHKLQEMIGEKIISLVEDPERLQRIGKEAVKDAARVRKGELAEAGGARPADRVIPAVNDPKILPGM